MTKKSTFKVDLFDCRVTIIFCKDIKKTINSYFRKYDQGTLKTDVRGFFYFPGAPYKDYYVFFDMAELDTDLVNHEKSHLVEEILIGKGIRAAGEIRAIVDGYISNKFAQIFKKRKIKL